MKPAFDMERLGRYLLEIRQNAIDIDEILARKNEMEILADKICVKAIKYSLVEITEAVSLTLQHILAKGFGTAVSGYQDAITKSCDRGILSALTCDGMIPFIKFRNMLVHRYWDVKDELLLKNYREDPELFYRFIDEVEDFIKRATEQVETPPEDDKLPDNL